MTHHLLRAFLPLAFLPLIACGQTPVSNVSESAASSAAHTPAAPANVQEDLAATLTKKLETAYGNQGLKVQSIQSTPIAGLYEAVVSGNQVVYVDGKADYMLVGDLIDINTRRSLTDERAADLSRVDYASLPLDKAIKEVRGKGTLQVVVFSDPDCPFCKRLENEFAKMNDITIYNFLMPILSLHPGADKKSEQIWCQPDRTAAWTNWMRQGKAPAQVAECENPVAETMSLGEQLGFNGTPTLVFPNGKTQSGYAPMPQLQETIKANQK